jgi:hypothetical protein
MTPDHYTFVATLRMRAPFLAEALLRLWSQGERYYIDKRVDIRGLRRRFNNLNNQITELPK